MGRILRLTCFALLATSLLLAPSLDVRAEEPGVEIQLDNDLFTGTGDDRDYSWGATLTFSSPQPGRALAPRGSCAQEPRVAAAGA